MSSRNLLKAKSVRHGSEFQIEVSDYSYAREVKYQYMSFRKRFLVRDHEVTYSARRINFLRRINYFKNNSPRHQAGILYGKFHSLSAAQQDELFQQFLQQSKDISVLWDHVRRLSLPLSRIQSLYPMRTNSDTPIRIASSATRSLTFANSFPKGTRRLSYCAGDAHLTEHAKVENASAMNIQLQALSITELLTPRHSNKSTFQPPPLPQNRSSTQLGDADPPTILKNLFEPMPFSNIDIFRRAQHPSKFIVGGRTVINKYLNEIFESIKPSDWILPYVITILLLFHAEDHKVRDLSILFHPTNTSAIPYLENSTSLFEETGVDLVAPSTPHSISSTSSTSDLGDTTENLNSSTSRRDYSSKVKKKIPIDPSVPVFPISSSFPSYQYLSTAYISQQTLNSKDPVFWIQSHLFLIDGFLFQCDFDQRFLVPMGFLFLDANSVHWVEKTVKIRGFLSFLFTFIRSSSFLRNYDDQ
jgi:hypothetical protein